MNAPLVTSPAGGPVAAKPRAAGVVLMADDGRALFVKRSPVSDHPGTWCFPGGHIEDGEEPMEAALREANEEVGYEKKNASDRPIHLDDHDGFSTFGHHVGPAFLAKLNGEHTAHAWASLESPPEPLHPGVKGMLERQAKGQMKRQAADSFDKHLLALDRDSVRSKQDGHLHISKANVSMADVNPYLGSEIPGWEELNLDPKKVYMLFRDPAEIEKAAATLNGKPLLDIHIPVSSDEHPTQKVVGAVGTNAKFEHPYLTNALVFWPQDTIDEIESKKKKELSCGYRYKPEMTPGYFNGKRYDGVMRDIVFNHVALVEKGRAGPDVVVGDSMENLMKPTRFAANALRITAAHIRPIMAKDSALDLAPLFKGVTQKNFSEKKPGIVAGLKLVKLAKDASMEGVMSLLDALEGAGASGEDEASEEEIKKMEEAGKGGDDDLGIPAPSEPAIDAGGGLAGFLKEKGMGEDDIKKACDFMKPKAADSKEDDDEKAKKDAADKAAKDAEIDDLKKADKAKDEKMEKMVDKPAMDAAIKAAVAASESKHAGIAQAREFVAPWAGKINIACDSAEAVHRAALDVLNVKHKDIHASALQTIIELQPKPGSAPRIAADAEIAMDGAAVTSFDKMFGETSLSRIGQV